MQLFLKLGNIIIIGDLNSNYVADKNQALHVVVLSILIFVLIDSLHYARTHVSWKSSCIVKWIN